MSYAIAHLALPTDIYVLSEALEGNRIPLACLDRAWQWSTAVVRYAQTVCADAEAAPQDRLRAAVLREGWNEFRRDLSSYRLALETHRPAQLCRSCQVGRFS